MAKFEIGWLNQGSGEDVTIPLKQFIEAERIETHYPIVGFYDASGVVVGLVVLTPTMLVRKV